MRVSTHLTGRFRRSDAATTATISGPGVPLEPNAPPTSGRCTRASIPSACLNAALWRWTSCADTHTSSPSASTPRGSIGAAAVRGIACDARTTWAARANAPSTSPEDFSKRSISSGSESSSS